MRTQKSLYDRDFNAWVMAQKTFLENGDFQYLDIQHLIEELEDLGGSNKDSLESHLIIILMHMLKQKYQPDKSSKSWNDSIVNAKIQIKQIIKKNPGLKNYLKDSTILSSCYSSAKRYAFKETGIELRKFEKECPWTLKEILGE